jgi:hypothetical protein
MHNFFTKISQLHHSLKITFFSSKLKGAYFIFSLALFSVFMMGNSGGPAAAGNGGRTGAPGDAGNCSSCHSGGNFGTVSTTISVFKAGTTTSVTSYNADSTYDVKVTVNHTSGTPGGYGFQMTALKASNTLAGSFKNPGSNVKISTSGTRQYPEQSSTSTSNIFTTQWQAPVAGTGNVTFYSFGNCVNGTGNTAGDKGGGGTLALTESIVVPVKISAFNVKSNKTKNILNWISSNEINNAYFNIQYSTNAKDFTTIGSVNSKATNGNSSNSISYSFTHENAVAQHNYYRLQQVDKDGKNSIVSETKEVSSNYVENNFSIFPNPVKNVANISIDNINETIVKVIDMNGVVVKELVKPHGIYNFKVDIANLSKGIYTISLSNKGQIIGNKKIIKL